MTDQCVLHALVSPKHPVQSIPVPDGPNTGEFSPWAGALPTCRPHDNRTTLNGHIRSNTLPQCDTRGNAHPQQLQAQGCQRGEAHILIKLFSYPAFHDPLEIFLKNQTVKQHFSKSIAKQNIDLKCCELNVTELHLYENPLMVGIHS